MEELYTKYPIWSAIILGAIGSILGVMLLNIIGRTNKGIKNLWIWYKEGRERLLREMIENKYKYFRHQAILRHFRFSLIINMGLIILFRIEILDDEESFLSFKIGYSLLITLFSILILAYSKVIILNAKYLNYKINKSKY
jgi:hypothetical protein